MGIVLGVPSDGDLSLWSLQAVDRSGNVVGSVGKPGNDWSRTRMVLGHHSSRQGGLGTMEALELSQVRCRAVGFDRVAPKVICLPVKPDRVRKYLGVVAVSIPCCTLNLLVDPEVPLQCIHHKQGNLVVSTTR